MNPLALSASGAALAAAIAIAVVIALYLLKPPLRRFVVPSSLIWDRVLKHTHAGRDRLRWWLSVLLAMTIAVAIVIAISRPQLIQAGGSAERLILVLDNSPTMATRTTDGLTRWDHAVSRAREILESQATGTRVWLADSMRRIPTPGFEDRDAANERLGQLRVSYGPTPRVPLPVQSGGGEAANPDVVVITDGVQITEVPESARLESVFEPVENIGITAFELRPLPVDPRRVQAFVEVANGGGTSKQVKLALTGIGGRSVTRTMDVPAVGTRAELIDVSEFDSGPIRAALAVPGDGLAADDAAYAWLPMRRVIRISLVSDGNPWLEKALRAQPRVQLSVIMPARYVENRNVDVWVFDRFAPRSQPAAPSLLFGPAKAAWLPVSAGELVNPTVAAWDVSHPLLDNISLHDLFIDRALKTSSRKDSGADTVLVAAEGNAPLAWAHEQGSRWVSLGFALQDSNFALHAAFPVFLNNALNWMVAEPTLIKAGPGTTELPMANARVVTANGEELAVRAIPGGSLVELPEPGFFTAVSSQQRLRIAVNILDRRITEVNRSGLTPMAAAGGPAPPAQASFHFDSWMLLLLIAVLLLSFEWWGWNRRVTL